MSESKPIELGPIMCSVSGSELSAEDRERLLHPAIGGVVLFADNCQSLEQIRQLTQDIHSLRSPKLLIAVDQEGGRVQRIKCDVTHLPPQARYGEIYDVNPDAGNDAAEAGGYLMAAEVLNTGIDISFSPVLDVASVQSQVIGDRAFHSEAHIVAQLAESWTRGMQKAGMKAVGKHFPGHGHVSADSHYEMPEDNRSIQEVLNLDLIPYRRLSERLSAVMTAHVLYGEITSAIPTYSSFWLEHILREVLVFHGAVFSDDLSMSGAAEGGDMETRVMTALMSGCDIALICQSVEDTDRALEAMETHASVWQQISWRYEELRPQPASHSQDLNEVQDTLFKLIGQ